MTAPLKVVGEPTKAAPADVAGYEPSDGFVATLERLRAAIADDVAEAKYILALDRQTRRRNNSLRSI